MTRRCAEHNIAIGVHMKSHTIALRTLLLVVGPYLVLAQQSAPPFADVIVRCDDAGMSHAVNRAIRDIAETGMPFSVSVMVPCPWFPEAVEILHAYPHVSVGLHLTLNAEWKGMRWGPVLGGQDVPSLVDSLGYFFPSRAALMAHGPKLDEVERELRAQIQRAYAAGLKPDYLDHHMSAAVNTPEMRLIVERLAAEYGLGISRYFGETGAEGVYRAPIDHKTDTLIALVNRLEPGKRHLFVFHVTAQSQEMDALIDQNTIGLPDMSKHRNAEFRAVSSPEFREALKERGIRMLTYADLMKADGTKGMKRPH